MELPKPGRWKAHITKQRKIAENTVEVSLWLDGPSFVFQAGQYVKITIPRLLMTDLREASRDLSLSSSPAQGNLITVAFRVSDSAFKKALIQSPEGAPVDVLGPLGVFTIPSDSSHNFAFIADGVGITPFLSMIRYATEKKLPNAITLLYVNSSSENAVYIPELEILAKQNNHFTFINKFGALDAEFIKQNMPEPANTLWYVAGPEGMTATAYAILTQMHIHEENITTEEFTGYDSARKKSIPIHIDTSNNENKQKSILDNSSFSKENLDAILQALDSTTLLSVTDLEGTITYANNKFIEESQYSRDELIGQNHRILKSGYHPQSFYDSMWHDYLLKDKTFHGEIKNKKKDGTFYWVDATIAPIFDSHKEKIGYVGIHFIVTKRKQAEESMYLYSNILEQTTQAWGMANLEGTMLNFNKAFVRLFGYSEEELLTMNYNSLIENTDQKIVQEGTKQTIETKQPFITKVTMIQKDGSKITVVMSVNGYFENNTPLYLYAFMNDITGQENTMIDSQNTNLAMMNILEDARTLEEKLQDEQARLKTILSTMGEGLFVVNAEGKVILMNETAQKILEISMQDALGKTSPKSFPMLFKDGKKVSDEERPLAQALKKGTTITGLLSDNYQYQLSSGRKIFIALIVTPMKNTDGVVEGAVVIFRDITEEKKLDNTRETFISIASHQLRTPLTSIRWYTEMLSDGDAGPLLNQQKTFVDNIYTGVLRLSETLNMLLSLSRVESGRIKTELTLVNLVDVTQNVIKELLPYSHAKNLTIDVKLINTQSAQIKIDVSMLRQVVMNLLSNAIRYTENKTTIQVEIEPKEDYWLYNVTDKGIGISEENKSRIFEKFFRADNAVQLVPDGNGLGLALVKDLVELWGGKTWFESELGKGSTFYFTIPYSAMREKTGVTLIA